MSPSRPKPPEYTVDTDVLVAGVRAFQLPPAASDPPEAVLLQRWLRREWNWAASTELLDEYQYTVLVRGASPGRVERIIELVSQNVRLVVPRPVPEVLPDPDDAHVIGTARAAGTAVLTRNIEHFPASVIRSVTPQQAMAEIDAYMRHPMRGRRVNQPRRKRRR